ncbi:hypothetical protein [Gordonia liuliyuniae]|uniref:MmgE/PrpD family protein n=1 Tax=Gordonia liuliyuniae TaxID=2911517 RepID=A0ABS9IWR8_9ACTN|nr:hypothetical protein [Gordonia liuliyuniae]MCF8590004.1 hypothetical protein [Gordonia liuliyuniae]
MTFDAASVVLSDPSPVSTEQLAEAALAAYTVAGDVSAAVLPVLDAVSLLGEPSFNSWADVIATEDGFPLLGTGRRASTYAALMWNGARLDAAQPSPRWAPLLAALAAAGADTGLDRVGHSVLAGLGVADEAAVLLAADPLAYPTLGTLAAAVAASLVGPSEGADLADVLDLAASLAAFAPDGRSAGSGWLAGHAAASGWLAARVPADVITPMPGSVVHTLSAVAGRPVAARDSVPSKVDELLRMLR